MKQGVLICFLLVLFFSCQETVFNAGLENRITAIIDMSPEEYQKKVDFTSDDNVGGCEDHDVVYIDKWNDGSIDNEYFTIRIEAKDYYKTENNCNEFNWYDTEQELIQHQLIINAYADTIYIEITSEKDLNINTKIEKKFIILIFSFGKILFSNSAV